MQTRGTCAARATLAERLERMSEEDRRAAEARIEESRVTFAAKRVEARAERAAKEAAKAAARATAAAAQEEASVEIVVDGGAEETAPAAAEAEAGYFKDPLAA